MNFYRHMSNVLRQNLNASMSYSSFNSHLSLNRLYPESKSNPVTPKFQKDSDKEFSGFIPLDQLKITYSRSSGPGGQNVNMVNSKVDVRFHVETANWINDELRKKILLQHRTKINKDGFLIIRSEKTRSQHLNLADVLERLREMMWKLSEPEPVKTPETEQKILRQREKAERIRLAEKRTRSCIKSDRKSPMIEM